MNPEEVKTYLTLKYGSIFAAHRKWCRSEIEGPDDKLVRDFFAYYLNKNVKQVDK